MDNTEFVRLITRDICDNLKRNEMQDLLYTQFEIYSRGKHKTMILLVLFASTKPITNLILVEKDRSREKWATLF